MRPTGDLLAYNRSVFYNLIYFGFWNSICYLYCRLESVTYFFIFNNVVIVPHYVVAVPLNCTCRVEE